MDHTPCNTVSSYNLFRKQGKIRQIAKKDQFFFSIILCFCLKGFTSAYFYCYMIYDLTQIGIDICCNTHQVFTFLRSKEYAAATFDGTLKKSRTSTFRFSTRNLLTCSHLTWFNTDTLVGWYPVKKS